MVALYQRLRAIRPQTVVSWLFQANVVAAPSARLAGVPRFISSVRSMSRWKAWPEFRRWWYWIADRVTAPLSDVIFANSRAAATDFVGWIRTDHEEIRVIPNGLDIDAFRAAPASDVRRLHGLDGEARIILSVGRLSAEKDHATLLRACARLMSAPVSWHVLIVGHGTLEPQLRDLSESLGLGSRITFCGRVDDPQSYYAGADLFVLTSRIEGLPNALIEAQAYGLAAVTTDSGGAVEVVEDGLTAITVPVGDDERLAEEILRLLSDHDARAEMGRAAMDSMRHRFGIDKMVASINQLTGRVPSDRT
jgi:glycosyltransferase involved in cell wall biosynthesis